MNGVFYYSTISGNTRLVWERLQELFQEAWITLSLQNLTQDIAWKESDFALFGCGTYWHGQIQNILRHQLETIWKEKDLQEFLCAAIGLWDHRYDLEYNTYAAVQVETWIQEHNGQLASPALRINRSPLKPSNQAIIEEWARNFSDKILSKSERKR